MLGRSVSRRLLLRHLSLGAGAVVLGGHGLVRGGVARAESNVHWDYPEADDWSKLSPEFAACGGHRQSPVDLGPARPLHSDSLALHWSGFAGDLTHNGHTLQVSPRQGEDGGYLELGGKMFKFLQFHLHHPSEHALAGKRWPLELHAVHQAADGTLAVIGILFRPGREHDGLGNVLATLPRAGQSRAMTRQVDVFGFLPHSATAYFYQGSLTTPPCSEIVSWIVLRDPVEAGIGQIEALTRAFPMNARPLQSGAGRLIGIDLF